MSNKPNKLGSGCLILFAIPFAGVGLFMAFLVVKSLLYWNTIQDWVETPCQIIEASLDESSDEDGTSYRAAASYQYQWAGKPYECENVSVHGGHDNIGKFQRLKADELIRIQKSGKPFRCFVNPEDPSQAILYRDLRFEMLIFKAMFGLIFGGVGFGLIVGSLWSRKRAKVADKLQQQQPDLPWLWRDDWATGIVRSSRWGPVVAMGAFALLWNLISWTVCGAFLYGEEDLPIWVFAICIGFPAIGLCMLGCAAYMFLRALKWGTSNFELATLPGVIGGKMAGVILATAGLNKADHFLLTLTCFEEKTRQTSDGTETYQDPVWQEDKTIVRTLADDFTGKTAIPVSFYIPYECHSTDQTAGYSWKLEAQAEVPGIDYHAEFEIPVFKTAESSPDPPAEEDELLADYEAPQTFETALKRCGGRLLLQTSSRYEVVFPMARNLGLALGVSLFTAIWTGVSVGILLSDVPQPFRLVFPLFDLLLLGILAWLWLEKVSLKFSDDGVEVQGGLLGLGKRHHFETNDIKSIVAEPSGMRSSNTVYQQITLKSPHNKKRKLIGGIRRRSDAETLAKTIRETVGLARAGFKTR